MVTPGLGILYFISGKQSRILNYKEYNITLKPAVSILEYEPQYSSCSTLRTNDSPLAEPGRNIMGKLGLLDLIIIKAS